MTKRLHFVVAGALASSPAAALAQSEWLSQGTVKTLLTIGLAVLVLFVGWLVARAISNAVFAVLKRTDYDQRLARAMGLESWLAKKGEHAVERFIAKVVYYLLMLIVIIAVLDVGGLSEAAGPIQTFLDTIMAALPLVGKAALILVVAFVMAYALRRVVTVALSKLKADRWLGDATETERTQPFSETAGTVVFWLIMLIGIAGAFEAMKIEAIAAPLRTLLDRVVLILPALGVAALILGVGWILGRLVAAALSNLLASVGFDKLPGKVKLSQLFEKRSASQVVGLLAFVVIMLHAAIAALDRLGLEAVSAPLGSTIDQFWGLVPALAVSLLILAVAVVVGRVVRAVVTELLAGVGFDTFLAKVGLDFGRLRPAAEDAEASPRRVESPSEVVGIILQVAVILIAVIQVLQNVGLLRWAEMVEVFLAYTYLRVIVALAILAVGWALGNYLRDLIAGKAQDGRAWLGAAVRVAVLVFAFTMALQQLEVAPQFVLLSFGLVFGAVCLAAALAFGLGSRDVAGEIVKKQYQKRKE